jgi:hypothetical protein
MPFVVYVMLLGYSTYTVSVVLIFAQCIKRHRARKIVERYYSEELANNPPTWGEK